MHKEKNHDIYDRANHQKKAIKVEIAVWSDKLYGKEASEVGNLERIEQDRLYQVL